MKYVVVLALVLMGGLIGAVGVYFLKGWPTQSSAPPAMDDRIVRGQEAVRTLMTNPASAYFEDVVLVAVGGRTFVCGRVNAKNSIGGYIGPRDFIFDVTVNSISLQREGIATVNNDWQRNCVPDNSSGSKLIARGINETPK